MLVSCVSVSFADDFSIDPYYGLDTQYIDLFARVAEKIPDGSHYVFFRQSHCQWVLVYSPDLVFVNNTFVAEEAYCIRYTVDDTQTSLSQPYFSYQPITGFVLDRVNYLVYSDLWDFPPLVSVNEKEGTMYVKALLLAVACAVLMWVFMRFRRALNDGFRFVS